MTSTIGWNRLKGTRRHVVMFNLLTEITQLRRSPNHQPRPSIASQHSHRISYIIYSDHPPHHPRSYEGFMLRSLKPSRLGISSSTLVTAQLRSNHLNTRRPSAFTFSSSSRLSAMVNSTSTSSSAKTEDYGHFSLLQSVDVEYAPVKVSKWRSERTGLTVVVGNHSSPVTNGYFTIASEIFDDTGRPHTLEHLVFLGSKDYPYKGVLDQLANRAGSNGTNAWTANDRKLQSTLNRSHGLIECRHGIHDIYGWK